jgi:hypothetical protein
MKLYSLECEFHLFNIVSYSFNAHFICRDEFSESQTAASQTTASGMNPYSSYYGATEHASRDSYRDEESRREWNEDTKQYY